MATSKNQYVLNGQITIIGSGFIGKNWAMLFVAAGYTVTLYDVDEKQISDAVLDIQKDLESLEKRELLRGKISAKEQFSLIKSSTDLKKALEDAVYVIECTPERLEIKKDIFTKLDGYVSDCTILTSSTSNIKASAFSENLKHRENILVAHPINPPYYVPLVELVPAPWTNSEIVQKVRKLMLEIGQSPVVLNKEVDGFAVNRMQYPIINECWNLVRNGIMTPDDVDTVMTAGLGRRYAFLGPLETIHLNANGIEDYCAKYGDGMSHVSSTMDPAPKLTVESCKETGISASLFDKVPVNQLQERIKWRNERLAALSKLKKDLGDL